MQLLPKGVGEPFTTRDCDHHNLATGQIASIDTPQEYILRHNTLRNYGLEAFFPSALLKFRLIVISLELFDDQSRRRLSGTSQCLGADYYSMYYVHLAVLHQVINIMSVHNSYFI